ncbi:MAG: FtsQ-type POTRA domain-containing protein [Alphaproteobacteria bacterium]|nr:FtsQ-type POTRA domain-containing protein [Alphaproteobacteria bacterium]
MKFYKMLFKRQQSLKPQNRFEPENETFKHLTANIFLLLFITCSIATGITIRDSLIAKQIEQFKEQLFEYTSAHGFGIQDIIVQGRDKTTLEALHQKIKLNRNDNILKVDLKNLKTEIENLPWVEKAELKRLYFPNILQISLKEKNIIALYQQQGKFYPVDIYGNVIYTEYVPNRPFLIIVGKGAPQNLFELIKTTSSTPELFSRIKAAVFHPSGRWDLIFDDLEKGITVKMPEENFAQAWQKLIKINNKHGIFKRKLTFIDLRYADKVTYTIADK